MSDRDELVEVIANAIWVFEYGSEPANFEAEAAKGSAEAALDAIIDKFLEWAGNSQHAFDLDLRRFLGSLDAQDGQ